MASDYRCFVCDTCVNNGEVYVFGGEFYCESCFYVTTTSCEHCGTRILFNDDVGDSSISLCASCFDSHYEHCHVCDSIISLEDAFTLEDDDSDTYYCRSCYDELDQDRCIIHSYSYKPPPVFHGEGPRYFGVELEIDHGGQSSHNAEFFLTAAIPQYENLYIKTDSSLEDGLELVTHPMSLEYHLTKMPWKQLVSLALTLGYTSHKANTCGLHVHVNRDSLGCTMCQQESAISKILHFVEHHWEELLKFSRRTQAQMNHWAARYGYKETPSEILARAKVSTAGRYACVNILNHDTIEFRMFRGTLKLNTLLATIELVEQICRVAVKSSDEEIIHTSWASFVSAINITEMPELIVYLKERFLYINEPIEAEEEDA